MKPVGLPFLTKSLKSLPTSNSIDRIIISQDHYLNRQITKRTKMIPEDIGIGSIEYFKDKRPFFLSAYEIDGWMT